MKKTIICNIPMKNNVEQTVYFSDDKSIPVSERRVRYPISAFLEKTLSQNDEIKVLMLIKKDEYSFCERNAQYLKEELLHINNSVDVKFDFVVIDSSFSQERSVHEQLMVRIVNEIEKGTHLLADITYGSKDMAIVVFAALGFAEKSLGCNIDNIVYGQASFSNGKVVKTKICDMVPLFYLSSVTNTICCSDPDNAKKMLSSLLSL